MKYLIAFLLLCTSLCAADPANGPLLGLWPITGHGYQYQLDQQQAGLPMELCIRIPHAHQSHGQNQLDALNAVAPILAEFDGQSIVLRCHNLTSYVDHVNRPRIPLEELPDRWQESPLAVRVHPDTGELDDTPAPTPWATSSEAWRAVGQKWATSPWFMRLKEILPNCTGVILRENNEGPIHKASQFWVTNNFRAINPDRPDRLIWPTPTTPVEWYQLEDPPQGSQWFIEPKPHNPNHLRAVRWKTDAECDQVDLHARHWVTDRRHRAPDGEADERELRELYTPFYHALYDGLREGFTGDWQGVPLRTVGYGGPKENYCNDASSSQFYQGYYRPTDLTDPEHLAKLRLRVAENFDTLGPTGWGELSIQMSARTVWEGAVNGSHDPVDPESYGAYMAVVCWMTQGPGREVRMTYFESYRTPADEPELPIDHAWQQHLIDIGRADLATVTVGDWERAVMSEMARVHDHPILNRYWRNGTTRIADSPLNDETQTQVYATETVIDGEPRKLLAVYLPGSPDGVVVNGHAVETRRFAYYLTDPVELVTDETPEPLTLEQRVESLERRVEALENR